ncbi:MAG TPA: metallophosphoesterase family protein [bacterium]|nr:metallophosphoesterase family protein [bacterium]
MKYGLFSDVHSNLEAMTAVAGAMKSEGVQEYLCLGDLVGYYANPVETLDLIESLHCWKIILGNHDAGCIGTTDISRFSAPAADAIRWTQKQLEPHHFELLKSLRYREEIGDIQLVHSSPFQSEEWHYLTKLEDLERNFRYFQGFICFFGHVHKPFIAEQKIDGTVRILQETEMMLQKDCRYIVNVGSVGQPRDGNPQTCYVVYDSDTRKIAIRRVDYDYATTAKKTLQAGLSDYLAQRLAAGK